MVKEKNRRKDSSLKSLVPSRKDLMKSILLSILLSCFICGVVPQEWNIHMANYEYADEIKKKKKKKGKKVKGKEKGKKGSWGIFKQKWKKKNRPS